MYPDASPLLCRHAPFLIPFEERARVFQTVVAADRQDRREMSAYGPQNFATIRRSTLMRVRHSSCYRYILVYGSFPRFFFGAKEVFATCLG